MTFPLLQKLQRLIISQWWSTFGMGGWVRCNGEDHNWLRWCSSSSLFWPHWPRQLWEWQNHWSQARAKFCRQVTSVIWIQTYFIQLVIRRTPGRLLDLALPSPLPHYGLHLGGESLLLGLADTLPPLRGSSSSRSLDPPLHIPTPGRIFEFVKKNQPSTSQLVLSIIATITRKGWLSTVTRHPSLLLIPAFTHFTFAAKRQGCIPVQIFARLQNHNNGIPPKYLLDDLKEGRIKKFKTTFQGQDASRLTSHLQDILWNNWLPQPGIKKNIENASYFI